MWGQTSCAGHRTTPTSLPKLYFLGCACFGSLDVALVISPELKVGLTWHSLPQWCLAWARRWQGCMCVGRGEGEGWKIYYGDPESSYQLNTSICFKLLVVSRLYKATEPFSWRETWLRACSASHFQSTCNAVVLHTSPSLHI